MNSVTIAAEHMKGVYALLDTHWLSDTNDLLSKAQTLIERKVRLFQYRDKRLSARVRLKQALMLSDLCRSNQVCLIVNDDLKLALDCGASGLHVGQDDIDPKKARMQAGCDFLIGVSCYGDLERIQKAEQQGCDYASMGRFFPSHTKPNARYTPIARLAQARALTHLPLVAIGGITAANGQSLIDAGADALAIAGALLDTSDLESACRKLVALFN